MPLLASLAALHKGVVRLAGSMTPAEVGLDTLDPCLEVRRPVQYDFSVQMVGRDLMVEGWVEVILQCQCVRCLEPFEYRLRLDPWLCALPLEGEDAPPIVHESVDLTPQMREDSFLALPQHPVCSPDCKGLSLQSKNTGQSNDSSGKAGRTTSAWSALDTLKLDR